ncbi:hypothetical protein SGLAD_v1c00710 [Spiroplasma gladiatoris]|uniref:N-acetyltransferase domain-containing protein n=1 Tax=Spiroplasma gladiatoris TaxID=2143 RepID=A0A4P7AGL6_9MOLU|nr:hypothetical protein [Spiroplasma gladiatoris]QBQ07272.1 hypothetical protein SGLAD_v1c00710 [Spiroplasma gladiatoris]
MMQIKNDVEKDINLIQIYLKCLKISTFKIDKSSKSQRISEAIINIIFIIIQEKNISEAYITLYKNKQILLHRILESWGFVETGQKNQEVVMTKFNYKKNERC